MKWEYKTIVTHDPLKIRLDEMGKEGWNLVSAFPAGEFHPKFYYIFKRPIDEVLQKA